MIKLLLAVTLLSQAFHAKSVAPLFSLEASNKLGNALVYFTWKGRNVIRSWTKPTQPRTAAVMNLRIKMKAMGKVSKVFVPASTLRADIIAKTPATFNWNAFWTGVAIKQFQVDNTAYDALLADLTGSTGGPDNWAAHANGLGITNYTLTVEGKSADHPALYPNHMALYSLAKACWYMEVLDAADVAYTDPETWAEPAIAAFATRILV